MTGGHVRGNGEIELTEPPPVPPMTQEFPDTLASFLSDEFVHHRPNATTSTKQEWLAAVQAALVPLAGLQVQIHRMIADDDHVVVYSQRGLPDSDAEIAVVDIWRIAGGLIAEGWEVIEPLDQVSTNLAWWKAASQR
jgi:predicted SnoaL-like aldol condensation-catalyzing enzyme